MAAATLTRSLGLVILALLAFALPACQEEPKDATSVKVPIGKTTYTLELALVPETRFKGLSGRSEIKPQTGMLFVFPDREVGVKSFVMRDCPIPIDIIYLDRGGRITAMHAMVPEPPRSEEEKALSAPSPGAPQWTWTNEAYENRLKHYSSRYSVQFAIEIAGGEIERLGLKEGQKIELDAPALRKRAK